VWRQKARHPNNFPSSVGAASSAADFAPTELGSFLISILQIRRTYGASFTLPKKSNGRIVFP
jgi:hypothetical protein